MRSAANSFKSRWAIARRALLCLRKLSKQAKAIRRYVVNAPHSRAKRVGGENGRNRPSHWLLSGQVFGRGRCNAIPPEYWIAGRRSAVAGRRPSVVVPWFCCAQPILRGSDRACGGGG